LLAARGRWDEALAAVARARDLDPLDASIHADLGRVLYLARRHDEAIAALHDALDLDPEHPAALKLLSDAYLERGLRREAAAAFGRWLAAVGVARQERELAAALLTEDGRPGLARRLLENPAGKSLDGYGVPLKVAVNHLVVGHRDQALEWLERAYRQKDARLMFVKVDPSFDTLHDDGRFQGLLRRVGL
jgi:tetratricopeptide (TPR) repeat protein